ncbi:MAG: hypothetical protein ACOX3T_06295 [Bdellovibrionota bacterium]
MKKINKVSNIFLLFLFSISFIGANVASATMTDNQAKRVENFGRSDLGSMYLFYALEKALADNGIATDLKCKYSSHPNKVPEVAYTAFGLDINNANDKASLEALLNNSTFPYCSSEFTRNMYVGKSVAANDETADEFCKAMGYEAYIAGSGQTSKYSSYGSELVVSYDTKSGNWKRATNGTHYITLTCGTTKCMKDDDCKESQYCAPNGTCVSFSNDYLAECNNGKDDDGDGKIDDKDPECKGFVGGTGYIDTILMNETQGQYKASCETYTMPKDGEILINLKDDDVAVIVKRKDDNKTVILAKSNDPFPFGSCAVSTPINQADANNKTNKRNGSLGQNDAIFYGRDGKLVAYFQADGHRTVPDKAWSPKYEDRKLRTVSLKAGDVVYLATRSDKTANSRNPNTIVRFQEPRNFRESVCDVNYGDTTSGKRVCSTLAKPVCSKGSCVACPASQVYNKTLKACVECISDTDCKSGQACQNNKCLDKYTCSKNTTTGKVVVNKNGVELTTKLDKCEGNKQYVYTCPSTTSVGTEIVVKETITNCKYGCDTKTKKCYDTECDANYGDTTSGKKACKTIAKPVCSDGSCVGCPNSEVYSEDKKSCVACVVDGDCAKGQVCQNNKCLNKYTCSKNTTTGKVIVNKNGVELTTKLDKCEGNKQYVYTCPSTTSVGTEIVVKETITNCKYGCDTKTKKCYDTECDANYGDTTSGKKACKTIAKPVCSDGSCVGCPNSEVYSEDKKSCVACVVDGDCAKGQVCQDNKCLDKYTCSKNTTTGKVIVNKNGVELTTKLDKCEGNKQYVYTCPSTTSVGTEIVVKETITNCKYGCDTKTKKCYDTECDANYGDTTSGKKACKTIDKPVCSDGSCVGCPNSEVYSEDKKSCVACVEDSDCEAGQVCQDNKCLDEYTCAKDDTGKVVVKKNGVEITAKSKTDKCENDKQYEYTCSATTLVGTEITVKETITNCEHGCNSETKKCNDAECDVNYGDTTEGKKACSEDKPICENGSCKSCPNNEIYNISQMKCVECNVDTDCKDGLVCDKDNNKCVDKQKAVIPLFNCIIDNLDGTYTAYFGYENPNAEVINVQACSNKQGAKNIINNTTTYCEQPSEFEVGTVKGAFYVPFSQGQTVSWTLQNNSEAEKTVSATSASVRCAPLEPYAQCIDRNKDGSYKAHFGYTNRNGFEVEIPNGSANNLSTNENVQPEHFVAGKIDNALSIDFTESATWNLDGNKATATKKTKPCIEVNCTETSIVQAKKSLHGDEFVEMLEAETESLLEELNPFPQIRDIEASADRRINRAEKNNDTIKKLVLKLPDVMFNCDNADFCPLYDNQGTLNLIERKLRKLRRQVGRTIRQRNIDEKTRTRLLNINAQILAGKISALNSIPRFANDCD